MRREIAQNIVATSVDLQLFPSINNQNYGLGPSNPYSGQERFSRRFPGCSSQLLILRLSDRFPFLLGEASTRQDVFEIVFHNVVVILPVGTQRGTWKTAD